MSIEKIRELNTHINIKALSGESFKKYGRIVEEYNFSEFIKYMKSNTEIPKEGNIYIPSVKDMEELQVGKALKKGFYGEMPIQIGYCNGKNSTLNGLEYHKSSEINIGVTDLVLLLGKIEDIKDNKYQTNRVEAFYIPQGKAVELYATTLHFAPCKTEEEGFKCVVILPKGTNLPLKGGRASKEGEDKLLFGKNKWLLVHESRAALLEKGAYLGLEGENIEIKFSQCKG